MAWLDVESETVVVRIVYDGPPTAGKTTTLQALAGRLGQGTVHTPEGTPGGRTLYFDWLEYTAGRFEGRPIRCELVSVPGQKALAARRRALLETADAVVFVGDTTRAGLPESLVMLDDLLRRTSSAIPPVGVVLQANKRDLPDVAPIELFRGRPGVAVVESIAARGDGIREAFVFAVRLALDRVRELQRLGGLALRQRNEDAAVLLARLKGLPAESVAGLLDSAVAEQAQIRAAAQVHAAARTVRVPDAAIFGGGIWPPVNGRVLLQEATAAAAPIAREVTAGEWRADSASGWWFQSTPAAVFTDAETARAALIRWAGQHAALAGWLTPERCIAVCDAGDGTFRLWQVVRRGPTLRARIAAAIDAKDPRRLSHEVKDAVALCMRVADHWGRAAWDLPCSLDTVGAEGGFAGMLPDAVSLRPAERWDRFTGLHRELDALVRDALGDDGVAAAGLARRAG